MRRERNNIMMLKSLYIILFLVSFFLPLHANIDAQIQAIQRAPVSERFKLMNAFKQKMIQMQEEERIKAMKKIQSITRSKHADQAFKELYTLEKKNNTKNPNRELARKKETDEQVENQIEEKIESEAENNDRD